MKHQFEEVNPELLINEYARLHKQGYKVQKVGLFIILAVVLMAALGLFGDGILSHRMQATKKATIEYERFYRFEGIMELKVELVAFENVNVISFPKEYLKSFEIKSITPMPESTNFKGDRSQFVFNGPGNGIVTFFLAPRKVGTIDGELSVNGSSFQVDHFIYP